MKRGLKILRIHGIDVYLHYSWWFIFALLAYSLAVDLFPRYYPDLSTGVYWFMGGLAAVLLFVSVLLHELTHSFVAKARNLNVESITLFFFGGVASLPSEDVKPKTEFWMALSGPLFSMALAGVLFLVHQLPLPIIWKAVTAYLWQINLVLGLFNLMPGYPLDGGRVFRAILMFRYNNLKKATRIASRGGKFFGGLLVFLGFLSIFSGNFGGLWFVFLGAFLWFIAKSSYEQVLIKDVLGKVKLSQLIDKKHVVLKPSDKFDKVISWYKKAEQDNFIVEHKKKFVGILDVGRVGRIHKGVVKNLVVTNFIIPAREIKVLSSKESAYDALKKLEMQNLNLLPVIEKGKVIGVVTRSRVTHYLSLEVKYGIEG